MIISTATISLCKKRKADQKEKLACEIYELTTEFAFLQDVYLRYVYQNGCMGFISFCWIVGTWTYWPCLKFFLSFTFCPKLLMT